MLQSHIDWPADCFGSFGSAGNAWEPTMEEILKVFDDDLLAVAQAMADLIARLFY
jgi:hypothetical protein